MPKILVIIDPEETEHSGLNRVREIPPTADVTYKVDLYIDAVPVMAGSASGDVLKHRLDEQRAWLDSLVEPLREVGYKIQTEVIAFTRLYEEIIRSADKFGADFVFKPLRQHGQLKRLFYTSTDWNLIRMCKTPLLLVSDQPSVRGKPVVAAIDAGDQDKAHITLNEAVLDNAGLLARVLEAPVHVLYAYGPAVVASRAAVADPFAYQIARDKYDEEFRTAERLALAHGIQPEMVHLREGAPDIVLTDYASETDAGILVLGTVARAGVAGRFIGNTAESTLERAQCDVFVIKQSDFTPPA
ncbi:MAG: universal stress protein [Pseudomonadota bacterium]